MFDSIILNADIYSLERDGDKFEAMVVDDGRIVKLYEVEPQNASSIAKEVIDAEGKTVLPAFTDGHFHFMSSAALQEIALNVSEIEDGVLLPKNLDGFSRKLKDFADGKAKEKPILCFNYIIASFEEDRLPTWKEIDAWVPGRIVMILSMDAHSSAYSSRALKLFGFDPNEHNGILVGEDHEYNMGKINDAILKFLSTAEIVKGVQHLCNEAFNYGITCIHCLDGFDDLEDDKSLWFLAKFGGSLPIRLRMFPQVRNISRVEQYRKVMAYPRLGGCGGWEMDGSVGSKTAAFYEPYKNEPENRGKLLFPKDKLIDAMVSAQKKGYQITSHAIGTRAIDVVLEAYSELFSRCKLESNVQRHRIDHFEFPNEEQVNKAIDDLGLLITAQPGYTWMDDLYQKSYERYLNPSQINRQIPLKTIMEKGGCLIGSSDSPVQHLNPFIQLSGMVNFPIEKEQLNMYQALQTYTINGAYSTFEESIRGTLSVGKHADFIIMRQDPFKVKKDEVAELSVDATYINGRRPARMDKGLFGFFLSSIFKKKRPI